MNLMIICTIPIYIYILSLFIFYIHIYTPQCTCRSATRCLLIPFDAPSISAKITRHFKLSQCQPQASGGLAYLISLGTLFQEEGMQQMDNSIIPELESVFPVECFHRILPQYAALKWFCDKVCNLPIYAT